MMAFKSTGEHDKNNIEHAADGRTAIFTNKIEQYTVVVVVVSERDTCRENETYGEESYKLIVRDHHWLEMKYRTVDRAF